MSALAPTRARQKVNHMSKNARWSSEEDHLLTKLMTSEGPQNTAEICSHFPGKTPQQISERWEKVLDPHLVKGSWKKAEDEKIIEFVKQYGTKNWTKLAGLLPGRIGKQCRERWRNHLDPSVNRNPWTPEEDQLLFQLHSIHGNRWVKIAERMSGRSDNCIKNRWNSTLKKQLLPEDADAPRRKRGRPSLSKNGRVEDDKIPKPGKVIGGGAEASDSLISPIASLGPSIYNAVSPPASYQSYGDTEQYRNRLIYLLSLNY